MENICFYHKNCSDGSAAAAVLMRTEPKTTFIPVQYDTYNTLEKFVDDFNISGMRVFVFDFSFKREIIEHIQAHAAVFVWLDHHLTAVQEYCNWRGIEYTGEPIVNVENENSYIRFDCSKSGAMLAWEFFNELTAPKVIQHVQDRDLWKFELEGTRELSCYLNCTHMKLQSWVDMINNDNLVRQATEKGKVIQEIYDTQIARLVKKAIPITIKGHKGLIVNSTIHPSEIGNELAKQSGTFGATWFYADGKAVVSLRSASEFNVGQLAKEFGGGGHFAAAGFSVTLTELEAMMKE